MRNGGRALTGLLLFATVLSLPLSHKDLRYTRHRQTRLIRTIFARKNGANDKSFAPPT